MGRKEIAKHLSLPPEFNAKLLSTATGCRPRVICADSMGTRYFGKLMENAGRLSPENLEPAAEEWEWFTDLFFGYGRPIPDWPQYIQIQRRLGRLDEWDDNTKSLRKQVRQIVRLVFKRLSQKYPRWEWAVKQKCFFTAAASDKYKFFDPSGKYWCILVGKINRVFFLYQFLLVDSSSLRIN